MAFRLYPDCRPCNLEVADLQKGLILTLDGKELVEEGVGFGVPVVKYADKTFFSKSAKASVEEESDTIVSKSFLIDAVSRKRIWKGPFISDSLYSSLHRAFARGYMTHKGFRPMFDGIMGLRRSLGVRTQFVRVQPRGRVNVAYRCLSDTIQVEVDLRELDMSRCEEILILNEQGSTFFRKYFDIDGLELINGQIGAWEKVEAEEAYLSGMMGTMRFSLKRVNGATLYRGWEQVKGRLYWAGLSYSLKPKTPTFTYTIGVREQDCRKG